MTPLRGIAAYNLSQRVSPAIIWVASCNALCVGHHLASEAVASCGLSWLPSCCAARDCQLNLCSKSWSITACSTSRDDSLLSAAAGAAAASGHRLGRWRCQLEQQQRDAEPGGAAGSPVCQQCQPPRWRGCRRRRCRHEWWPGRCPLCSRGYDGQHGVIPACRWAFRVWI